MLQRTVAGILAVWLAAAPQAAHAQGRIARLLSPRAEGASEGLGVALALLIRQYAAEAFGCAAGSMAPTILGRHKELTCPKCACRFAVSASIEASARAGGVAHPAYEVVGGTCPICRYTTHLGIDTPKRDKYASASGPRFLVEKLSYRLGQPQRWDLPVFRYAGSGEVNYVKRIVGLPGETVRIRHGDVFVRRGGDERFVIARRPPATVRAMLRVVDDTEHVVPQLLKLGWPARWQASRGEGAKAGRWTESEDHRALETDGASPGEVWIRYRHVVPGYDDWQHLAAGRLPPGGPPKPQLISDFFAYNTERTRRDVQMGSEPSPQTLGLHWVGDLAIEGTVEVRSRAGQVVFELVEGGRTMQCRIDVATGEACLAIDRLDAFRPVAPTRVRGPGTYRVLFANVDDQLLLWIDDGPVVFDGPTSYEPLGNTRPRAADLAPAGVASRGAALRLSRLRVLRDGYYIAMRMKPDEPFTGAISDFAGENWPYGLLSPSDVAGFLSDEDRWDVFEKRREVDFPLEQGQYLVLGDNSAQSKDSRFWERDGLDYFVRREALLGRACWTYFPRPAILR